MKSKQRSAYFQLQITIITAAPQAAESRLAHMEVWPRMSFISSREYVKEMKYLSDTCFLWVLIWLFIGVPVKGWITNLSGYMWILFTEVWKIRLLLLIFQHLNSDLRYSKDVTSKLSQTHNEFSFIRDRYLNIQSHLSLQRANRFLQRCKSLLKT